MEAPPTPHRAGVWVGQGRVRLPGASKVPPRSACVGAGVSWMVLCAASGLQRVWMSPVVVDGLWKQCEEKRFSHYCARSALMNFTLKFLMHGSMLIHKK